MLLGWVALYYGFVEHYFVGRLFTYGIMSILGIGAVYICIGAWAIRMASNELTLNFQSALQFKVKHDVPIWQRVTWALSMGVYVYVFYITVHPVLIGLYVFVVAAGRIGVYSINKDIKRHTGGWYDH